MTIAVRVFAFLLLDCGQQSARGTLQSMIDTVSNECGYANLRDRRYKGIQDRFEVSETLHGYLHE
jgi:hypothetical protein